LFLTAAAAAAPHTQLLHGSAYGKGEGTPAVVMNSSKDMVCMATAWLIICEDMHKGVQGGLHNGP